jgi:hypothetical protein
LEDELEVQETKLVWKWEKGKLSPGTKQLLVEKVDNLRGRRFERHGRIGSKSINARLAKKAENSIERVKNFKTKKSCSIEHQKKIVGRKIQYGLQEQSVLYLSRIERSSLK